MSQQPYNRDRFLKILAGTTAAAAAGVPGIADARRRQSDADVSKLYADAKREGTLTWWQSGYPQNVCDDIRTAFKAKYPGIEVVFIRQTAQVVYQRILNDLKANAHECDVFATSDEGHLAVLKKKNVLAVHVPPDMDKVYPQFRQLDPDETYQAGSLAFVILNYNPKKVGAPVKRWTDLLDPRFKNQVSTGHPGFGGYAAMWVLTMEDKYGWDYFKKLELNKPKINRSIYETVIDVMQGERIVSAGVDALALEKKAAGNPIDVRFPDDEAVLGVNPVAIMKESTHPNAARLFANFYYSREFANVVAKTYNVPIRADVNPSTTVRLQSVKYHWVKLDRQIAGVPEVIAKWRETFGI